MDANNDDYQPATELLGLATGWAREFSTRVVTADTASKTDASPVTAADLAIQALVVVGLRERYGDVNVVGEESTAIFRTREDTGQGNALRETVHALVRSVRPTITATAIDDAIDSGSGDGLASSQWIIDPIDGTRGYLKGQQYCVCLAKVVNGIVRFGGAGCPRLGERGLLVAATRGAGAWAWDNIDESSIAHSAPRQLQARCERRELIVASESPEATDRARRRLRKLAEGLAPAFEARPMESQCKFVLVATGDVDLAVRFPSRDSGRNRDMVWDYAGAVVMAEEAGAAMTDCRGVPLRFGRGRSIEENHGILCAAMPVHEAAVQQFRSLEIEPDSEPSSAKVRRDG